MRALWGSAYEPGSVTSASCSMAASCANGTCRSEDRKGNPLTASKLSDASKSVKSADEFLPIGSRSGCEVQARANAAATATLRRPADFIGPPCGRRSIGKIHPGLLLPSVVSAPPQPKCSTRRRAGRSRGRGLRIEKGRATSFREKEDSFAISNATYASLFRTGLTHRPERGVRGRRALVHASCPLARETSHQRHGGLLRSGNRCHARLESVRRGRPARWAPSGRPLGSAPT